MEAGRVGRAEILVWEGDLGLCEGLVICCRPATLQLIGNTLRMSLGARCGVERALLSGCWTGGRVLPHEAGTIAVIGKD